MSFEDDARALIELVKKQGASELTEDVLKQLHATKEELTAYAGTFGRRVPPALRSSLAALNAATRAAAKSNTQLLDSMEGGGVTDYDPTGALLKSTESYAQQAKQEAAAEADRRYKSRLHEERQRIREDLLRKGWTKPLTKRTIVIRKVLEYLHHNASLTVDAAAVLLFGEFKGDKHKVVGELSRMRREGYLTRSDKGVYGATDAGRQYDTDTGELPCTGKIGGRTGLLNYLQETGGATKKEIDALTTSASVLFNSVRDGDVELSDGRYYVSGKGMEKLQRTQENPASPREVVITYLQTHGAIANREARKLTGLSDEKARALLDSMRTEGVIRYAGAVGNVLTDGYIPQISLEGSAHTEQVLNYAASLGGIMPLHQMINLFPGFTERQKADLIHHLTHGYDGSASYCERRDGNLVMTQRGYERIGLTVPVTP